MNFLHPYRKHGAKNLYLQENLQTAQSQFATQPNVLKREKSTDGDLPQQDNLIYLAGRLCKAPFASSCMSVWKLIYVYILSIVISNNYHSEYGPICCYYITFNMCISSNLCILLYHKIFIACLVMWVSLLRIMWRAIPDRWRLLSSILPLLEHSHRHSTAWTLSHLYTLTGVCRLQQALASTH